MDLEQEDVESKSMFGDLYEWNKCSVPCSQITSLLISDDNRFSHADLTIICEMCPLRQLFLHHLTNLDKLPPSISRLKYLKVLSITHCNSLLELPLAMRFLFNLETLRLDCPYLGVLPGFLCLMPSLNLLLLRKTISLCNQCKQHPKKSSRIIILPQPDDVNNLSTNFYTKNVLNLSILSANNYISKFSTSSFYHAVPFKTLWPVFEAALDIQINRCIICLGNCSNDKKFSINFTRLLNCKCVHLIGFFCSDSCKLKFHDYLSAIYFNAEVLTTIEPEIGQPQTNINPLSSAIIRRRIKKILCWWSSCIPRYHKKSYTVNAR